MSNSNLKARLEKVNAILNTYKEVYKSNYEELKTLIPKSLISLKIYNTTLKKLSDIAISRCHKDCEGACGDCDYLKAQIIILDCLRQIARLDNVNSKD